MQRAMPRTSKPKGRAAAPTNPNVAAVLLRTDEATHAALDAWVAELNAASRAAGDPREWTRQDVLRAILSKRLRDRKPGDLP